MTMERTATRVKKHIHKSHGENKKKIESRDNVVHIEREGMGKLKGERNIVSYLVFTHFFFLTCNIQTRNECFISDFVFCFVSVCFNDVHI